MNNIENNSEILLNSVKIGKTLYDATTGLHSCNFIVEKVHIGHSESINFLKCECNDTDSEKYVNIALNENICVILNIDFENLKWYNIREDTNLKIHIKYITT